MKVQLKFKNKVYENYLIDENGIIYDLNGNIQPILIYNGRPHFKGYRLHSLVAHSIFGYKEGYDVHHLNFDKFDNRSCNLIYLTRKEHTRLHSTHFSKEILRKRSKGISIRNTGRVWCNNGSVNKFVYPDQIPDGFVRGLLRKI
jgi:hypothetical protein